jgi:hypothetical protein
MILLTLLPRGACYLYHLDDTSELDHIFFELFDV